MHRILLLVLLLAGCAGPALENQTQGPLAAVPFKPVSYEFVAEFLAGGVDAPQTFPFAVPEGAGEVATLLTWTMTGAVLEFQILDSSQTVVADGWAESDQRRFVATTQPPAPGTWSIEVSALQGVDIHFTLNVTARLAEPYGPISQAYTLQRGAFAEINLNMVPGDSFNYTWSADGDLYFNIHYHASGTTERPVEYTGQEHEGSFTAPNRETYSLLLRNDGLLPVAVSVEVDGTYRLHSMSR